MSDGVYVVLFRGINVGGRRAVKMEALRKVLTGAGFGKVATYIQSGNVVLTSDEEERAVAARVEKVFTEAFGFSSRPAVLSRDTWKRIVEENPFPEASEGRQVHAVLLDAEPATAAVDALRALASTEQIEVEDGVLYLYTPDGFGRSKVAEKLDSLLKVPLTARNWNTVLKLLEMAEAAAG